MNVLRQLSGVAGEESVGELRCVMAMHDEPKPGFIRQLSLGDGGMMLVCGEARLLIPLGELFRVAEGCDVRFVPPAGTGATGLRGARGGKA